jgi:ribonuclease Z
MHLLGRTTDLHLYCPEELKEILDIQHKYSQTYLNFNIVYHFHKYVSGDVLFEDEKVIVKSVVLNHRVPCCGFTFFEKPLLANISADAIVKYAIPSDKILEIKKGADFIAADGSIIPNAAIVSKKYAARSYAYCSDTCYDESLIPHIKNVDLLYHEATFMNDKKERAKETYHSTTEQAATIAQKAAVKQLMIGHYSARYKDLQPMLDEAKCVFENTILAIEGETVKVELMAI